jgi:hypothetical protein
MADSGYESPVFNSPEPPAVVLCPWKDLPAVKDIETHALFLGETRLSVYTSSDPSITHVIRRHIDGLNDILNCTTAAEAYKAASAVVASTCAAADASTLPSIWAIRMIHPVMALQIALVGYPDVAPDLTVWE